MILVLGRHGQLAQSLSLRATARQIPLRAVGRPQLELLDRSSIDRAVEETRPSIVINATAYTAVDKAENDADLAYAVNSDAVEHLGRLCDQLGIGVVHISTDYVFDGQKPESYVEGDPVSPLGVYGRSKLAGEERLRAATAKHAILRTAWVYSPYGNNFLKTMLRLGQERPLLSVVNDQIGCPTYAPHLAETILDLADQLTAENSDKWGTYHVAGTGEASWYDFAREIFVQAQELGFSTPELKPIATAEYPTPAKRPANSRLDTTRLQETFGLKLPDWRSGTSACLAAISSVRC